VVVLEAPQPDFLNQGSGFFLRRTRTEQDVLFYGQPGEERVRLEHHAAVRAGTLDRLAVEQDAPGGGPVEAGDDAQQRHHGHHQPCHQLFGSWKTPHPFERVPSHHFDRPGFEDSLLTPDKANAALRAGLNVRMRDDHPDFPALVLANQLLGGTSTARVPARVREKEGLSYSTYSWFSASQLDEAASFNVSAIFAPQNRSRVERAIREELGRAVQEGFGADEVEAGKRSVLEARRLARSQDRALASRLGHYLFVKRTFAWDSEFEAKIAALTPQQVNAALRRHIDPARLSVVVAGDLKKP